MTRWQQEDHEPVKAGRPRLALSHKHGGIGVHGAHCDDARHGERRSRRKVPRSLDVDCDQLPLRREWQHSKENDDDMEVGCAEGRTEQETEGVHGPVAPHGCEEEDLDTLKSGGKATFQGYCSHCWSWRHRRVDCKKRLATEGNKGGDGKVKNGEGTSESKGGWTQKVGWNGGWNKGGFWKGDEEKAKVTKAPEFRFCRSTTLMAT